MAKKKSETMAKVEDTQEMILETTENIEERLEQYDAELQMLMSQHSKMLNDYNTALENEDYDECVDIDDKIADIESKYASKAAQKLKFEVQHADDPMMFCIERLTYPVLSHRDPMDKELKRIVRIRSMKDKDIDLLSMAEKISGLGGEHWINAIQRFNKALTLRVVSDRHAEEQNKVDIQTYYKMTKDDSIWMKKFEKQLLSGEVELTHEFLIESLQQIVDDMVGEGHKVEENNFMLIYLAYAKKGKGNSLTASNHTQLTNLIKYMINEIVTGKPATVNAKLDR